MIWDSHELFERRTLDVTGGKGVVRKLDPPLHIYEHWRVVRATRAIQRKPLL